MHPNYATSADLLFLEGASDVEDRFGSKAAAEDCGEWVRFTPR
jgi:hypothetical protein